MTNSCAENNYYAIKVGDIFETIQNAMGIRDGEEKWFSKTIPQKNQMTLKPVL